MVAATIAISGCEQKTDTKVEHSVQTANNKVDVENFLAQTGKELERLNNEGSKIEWIYQNFITDDTAALSAAAAQEFSEAGVKFALAAAKFDKVEVSAEQRRKLNMLKQALVLPAPQDSEKSAELATIAAELGGMYGKGTYTNAKGEKLSLGQLSATMAESRNYEELLDAWQGWRTISPEMKPLFVREVELANEGAQGLGYPDLGAMWRSNYDMSADEFATELDRLWGQVKPLYDALHCHVRAELGEH